MKKINLILAVDEKNWLGKDNALAWNIPEDLRYFKDITTKTQDLAKLNAVIMWRKTWESIPAKFKPLSNRVNCILTKDIKRNDTNAKIDDFVMYFNSLWTCILSLEKRENIESIFVIWWASLYNELIKSDLVDTIYITKIKWDYNCDRFFDGIPSNFSIQSYSEEKNDGKNIYSFWKYKKEK